MGTNNGHGVTRLPLSTNSESDNGGLVSSHEVSSIGLDLPAGFLLQFLEAVLDKTGTHVMDNVVRGGAGVDKVDEIIRGSFEVRHY